MLSTLIRTFTSWGRKKDAARVAKAAARIAGAIKARVVIQFRYEGDEGDRRFEPYILYRGSNEQMFVAGYEIYGTLHDSMLPCWSFFDLGRLNEIQETSSAVEVRDTFPVDERFAIVCKIDDDSEGGSTRR